MADQPDQPDQPGGELETPFELLAEMTRDFGDSLDVEATLARALERIVRYVGAEAGSLWLLERDQLVCCASVGAKPIKGLALPEGQGIIGRCMRENRGQAVLDVARDPAFAAELDAQSGFRTHSLLCAPMTVKGDRLGAIELVNKRGREARFAAADLRLLETLAVSAALSLTNARMAASLVDHERVRRELELAAEIQRGLLPAARESGFPIAGANLPAREVSGDFYDFIPLERGRIGFCLGDVSGKGMNAALLMAKTASLYRCLAREGEPPGRLLARLNREVAETATRGMFVTMVAGVLDPGSGRVQLANAGHEPPLQRGVSGGFVSLPAEVPPLGIDADLLGVAVPELEIELDGGELWVCSDGLTEACSDSGPLGTRGLEQLIEALPELDAGRRLELLLERARGLELHDDLTLLVVSDARART